MTDFLTMIYPWVKALHVMAVIAWMAGLFYLPRLFVHHTEKVTTGSQTDALFQMMEMKLLRIIMNPAMIATWIFGLTLAFTPGVINWSEYWPWIKALSVIAMTGFHMWLAKRRKIFVAGTNDLSGRDYRIMNEVPTLLMIFIVIAVIVRPF